MTNCHGLKMQAPDGKMRLTDVADTEQLFRLIQSIPSPKAEPFKLWLAQIAVERLDELQDPEISIDRALNQYIQLGYSESWINQRLKSIEIRKELTDEWKSRGIKEGQQFAILTDIITQSWSGKTTKEYKILKGLKKENLRDNMTNTELILNMLADASTKDISKAVSISCFAFFTMSVLLISTLCLPEIVSASKEMTYSCSSFILMHIIFSTLYR